MYSLTSVNTTTANITPKSIVGDFTAASRVYDGTTSANVLTRTVVPLTGDSLSLTGGTATFADKNVGTGKTSRWPAQRSLVVTQRTTR